MKRILLSLVVLCMFSISATAEKPDGNRLTYLDENNPYYPHKDFPKLITPQWVGEEGVEAVVILAIDDMRDTKKYEQYLRPILIRLKQIDGRAPVSIMSCNVDPKDEQIQQWLAEGLSIEVHTVDHPCPLLQGGDFKKAKSTYDRCVDLMNQIPNNKPVAFRMPCCDSLNTVSPRFYAEIFNKTTEKGKFLQASSSVFNIFTSDDSEIPRELVLDQNGSERFKKYLPKNLNRGGKVFNTFVNTIENYPYPYVINKLCWEFPCVVPSDWSAQHLQGKFNPRTVEDLKAALDITVHKKGVMNLVFHPHGWIRNDQVVDIISHAVKKHGKKVKFLTFREAVERLNKNLLGGQPLRAASGRDNGVRVLDVDNDGFMDVIAGNLKLRRSRIWSPTGENWMSIDFPLSIVQTDKLARLSAKNDTHRFGIFRRNGSASVVGRGGISVWHYRENSWQVAKATKRSPLSRRLFQPRASLLRDVNGDGVCEWLISEKDSQQILFWHAEYGHWVADDDGQLAKEVRMADDEGRDAGLRFIDINEDGHDDIVFSNHERYGIWLFKDMKTGWSIEVLAGKRDDKQASGRRKPPGNADQPNRAAPPNNRGADTPRSPLPPIVRKDGSDNGFFVHSRHLFWQNEDTANLTDLVDRRSFDDLLKNVQPAAKSPEMSLKTMHVRPGFEVQLVAAEPLVKDPVAFDWGADGKLWVAEMADYPSGIPSPRAAPRGTPRPGGRIRFLQDTTGDGQYDKSTVFLDGVRFPNGVMAWKKGVLVSAAPEIFYAEDTDGDGKADKKEVLYTGFVEGNQQHRVNGFAYGLDNWIYCANGDSGGVIKSAKTGQTVNISGRDFRIKPDEGLIDAQSGRTQFGRNRDDWGNWFGCNNSNPMFHYVLADHYLRRNPHVAAPNPRVDVPQIPGAAPVFPRSRTLERFNDLDKANRFTSACSTIVYRDDLFGFFSSHSAFVCEPVHNLVSRSVIGPKGVTFTSRRAEDEQMSEFLASSDNWFRPVFVRTGPDGALWVADMYRHVIEHPKWIPEDWQKRLDLRAGDDKGRIYRVLPINTKGERQASAFRLPGTPARLTSPLDKLTTPKLVAALNSSNGWQRDTVQRLLIERNDKTAVPLLEKMLLEGRDADKSGSLFPYSRRSALPRLHALCTLDGLNALEPTILLTAINDPHPGVRRHAVRISEKKALQTPGVLTALLKLVDDDDSQLQLQLACSLGEWDDPRAAEALAKLALKHQGDPYLTAAVMSSLGKRNLSDVLTAVLGRRKPNSQATGLIGRLLGMADSTQDSETVRMALQVLSQPDAEGRYAVWQMKSLSNLTDALTRRKLRLKDLMKLSTEEADRIRGLFRASYELARDSEKPTTNRITAIALLSRAESGTDAVRIVRQFLKPQEPVSVQAAAVAGLARVNRASVPEILLAGWKGHSPAVRSQILDALLARSEWTDQLLTAIEAGTVLPAEVDAVRRQWLLAHGRRSVAARAAKLLAGSINADRQKVVVSYSSVLKTTGDKAAGQRIFKKRCATCHQLKGEGKPLGPDLAALTDKSPQAMLAAILDPNRAVEAKFISYSAVTADGLTHTGLLASETGNSITLVAQEGKEQVILRADLERLQSSNKSFMPEGMEKDLSPKDVADVIAYVAATGPARKEFAGNKPEIVVPQKDGRLLLTARNCEIYGSTLVFEQKYENLGFWGSASDVAAWTVGVDKPGVYEAVLTYSCFDGSAGNRFVFAAGDERLSGSVTATGSWAVYRDVKLGTVKLKAGRQRMSFRAAEKPRQYLLDFKSIRLVPAK